MHLRATSRFVAGFNAFGQRGGANVMHDVDQLRDQLLLFGLARSGRESAPCRI